MTNEQDTQVELAHATTTPDVEALAREFRRCYSDGGWQSRMEANSALRAQTWPGQTRDGLAHKKYAAKNGEPKPWDKFPDSREGVIDDTISSLTDLLVTGFWNSRFRVDPSFASRFTAGQVGELRKLLSHVIHGMLRGELVRVVERLAETQQTFGLGVVGVGWVAEQRLERQTVTVEQLASLAGAMEQQQGVPPGTFLAQAQALLLDPAQADNAAAYFRQFFPHLRPATARRVVKSLRETGTAQFPYPVPGRDQAEIRFLLPFRDVVWPPEAFGHLNEAPFIAERRFFNVAQLEVLAAQSEVDGRPWPDEFLTAARASLGWRTEVHGGSGQAIQDPNSVLIELVWHYQRAVDEDGVPAIYVTCYLPHHPQDSQGRPLYAYHDLCDYKHGQFPFKDFPAEYVTDRLTDARGVPDKIDADSAELKRMRDGLAAHMELSIGKTLIGETTRGVAPKLTPFGFLQGRPNQFGYSPDPGGKPELGLQMMELQLQRIADRFGLLTTNGHQGKAQMRQQRLVNNWLLIWGEVFWQVIVLTYQNWTAQQLEAVLGKPPTLTADLLAKHHCTLWFDVRSLDSEWVIKMVQALQQFVLPLDAGGVVDRAKLVEFILNYFEPTLAQEVTMTPEAAQTALYDRVRNDVLQMAAGNEALYTENDPTAPTKLKYLQQIIQANPNYHQLLAQIGPDGRPNPGFNQRFALLMQKYSESLTQSAVQEQNKTVGRIGVNPLGGNMENTIRQNPT